MTVVADAEVGDPALPPVPDGAVMVTLKIARFNPENPDAAGWQSFRVPCLPSDRLLNLLLYVKGYLDGTLTFRRSCAHGVCGSDAMRVNGVNRLACKVLMRDLLPEAADLGAIRQTIVQIQDSVYLPSQMPQLLEEMLGLVVTKAQQVHNPLEAAFFLWVNNRNNFFSLFSNLVFITNRFFYSYVCF